MGNTIKFQHDGRQVVGSFSNGTQSVYGWTWDGTKLVHSSKQVLRFNAEKSAEMAAAVKAAKPAKWDELTGAQVAMLPEAERKLYKFIGTRGDVNGIYSRQVAEAVTVTVEFRKADLA